MSQPTHPSMPRATLSLRSDSITLTRRSLEKSPSRSSVRSSSSQSQTHTPVSSVPDTPLLPTRPPSPEVRPLHAADSNSFLTALAAQERRVLELREELHKASEDLEKLKQQWAVHEATNKDELRLLQQLQPLIKPLLESSAPSGNYDSANASSDIDRRRITSSSIKTSHRKVFAGSRHTHALSLLSSKDPGSHSDILLHGNETLQIDQTAATQFGVPTTVPESAALDVELGLQKEVIMEAGKQLVGDFRQGLWTFFEDFKQLTVGDEGAFTTGLRDSPTLRTGKMAKRQSTKEKRSIFEENLAKKSGSLDVVGDLWTKPQVKARGHAQRVSRALDKYIEADGPTPIPVEANSEREDDADSSNSAVNG